ncbi:MAG: HAD-IA family hydrolase [Actinomycetota bacterium]|nr:HAD-IA family hydrolase [Actinomycetota bacterium]
MPPIEAVLIDVGGVLLLPDHDRIAAALAQADVNVDRDLLDHAHYAGVAALDQFTEGDREIWVRYNRAFARACNTPEDALDDAVEHLLNEFATGAVWSRMVPGSVEALQDLAALDVKLAIVSNADGDTEQRLRELGICQIGPGPGVEMAAILDSTVVGVAKPDPRIFELALDSLDVPAESTMHVGDTPGADVDGAHAAGVHPVLLDPFELHTDLDVERVGSLADVVGLVQSGQPA